LPFFPAGSIAAREHRGDDDEMTGIEVRGGELAFDLGSPEIRPALERHAFDEVGPVADGVDIGPGADVIGTDLGLGDQILGVRDLGEIELLVETIVGIEPADVRRRERDVALGITLGQLLFVEPIDRAARDVLDRHARGGGKFLADEIVDHVTPAAAPHADDELVLSASLRRRQECRQD
jgi:hypothetical protein